MELKKTPLHGEHLRMKARMAPFAGYDMPILYDEFSGGMLKEHLLVRQAVGMFDVSHMGEFWIRGGDAMAFLNKACTRPVTKMLPGKAQYAMLLRADGGIIDDIIVYKFDDQKFWMVVNASNMEKDWNHLQNLAKEFSQLSLENVSEQTALIAVQGPQAAGIVSALIPKAEELKYYHFFSPQKDWIVARTGYTGEDGFEIFLPSSSAVELWTELEKRGVKPIGLGARDTLRLEVGFPLYGHELTEDLYPQETFASFAMDPTAPFLGAEMTRKPARYMPVAISTAGPKPIRAEEKLYLNDLEVGFVTSGSVSPIKKVGMALCLVKTEAAQAKPKTFMLESGGKRREALAQDLPFVTTARVKGKKV